MHFSSWVLKNWKCCKYHRFQNVPKSNMIFQEFIGIIFIVSWLKWSIFSSISILVLPAFSSHENEDLSQDPLLSLSRDDPVDIIEKSESTNSSNKQIFQTWYYFLSFSCRTLFPESPIRRYHSFWIRKAYSFLLSVRSSETPHDLVLQW